MYMRFLSRSKVQTAVSKYLGFFPKIRGGDYSARAWVKTATSAIIFFLNYSVMWYGGSVKGDSL